jgi:DNA invertase Pin-like site-specific DNA recombinase
MTMFNKAAQYVRMSSDQQALSIDTQKVAIALYAGQHGLEIIRTYADEGKSGVTLAGRPAMQQLLIDVTERDCPFDVILVLDVSRWGRFQDVDESAFYEWTCRKNGVRVQYVAESFLGSGTPFDSILKQLKRAMAAEYSRELAEKSRAGQVHVVNLGFAVGNLPCIGYRRQAVSAEGANKGVLFPRDRKPALNDRVRWILGPLEEVEAVRRIFDDYTAGVSLTAIANRLHSQGMRSHDGAVLNATKMRVLLKTEAVTGTFAWGARRRRAITNIPELANRATNNMVPPIIDRPTWEKAQVMLKAATWVRHFGMPREVLIDKLRLALTKNPRLTSRGFRAMGLADPLTYLRHFGSLFPAYAAAGRTSKLVCPTAPQLRQKFADDVLKLLGSSGISARRGIHSGIVVNGVEVRVRATKSLFTLKGGPRRERPHVERRIPGWWVLLLRLNEDGRTGKDFFLFPPHVNTTFSVQFSGADLPGLDVYRLVDAEGLVGGLRAIGNWMSLPPRPVQMQIESSCIGLTDTGLAASTSRRLCRMRDASTSET